MSRPIHSPRRLGPGSVVMVVGLVAFGLYGYLSQPGTIKTSYYEADASGKLKLVDRPSVNNPKPLVPLARLKPEPSIILEHADLLQLQVAQSAKLDALAKTWQERKREFQRQMGQEQKTAQPAAGSRISLSNLNVSLSEYSRLSVEYDLERQELWSRSLAVLDASQRQRIEKYLAGGSL